MHSPETRKKIGDALRQPVYFDCYTCGKVSWDKPSSYARKKKHFCGQACYTEYKKVMPRELHPRFGSGNNEEERKKRRKARSDLNHAIRDGELERPLSCEAFIDCFGKPEAHHDDYDKPLEVRWLCFKHHRAHHKAIYENPELLNA